MFDLNSQTSLFHWYFTPSLRPDSITCFPIWTIHYRIMYNLMTWLTCFYFIIGSISLLNFILRLQEAVLILLWICYVCKYVQQLKDCFTSIITVHTALSLPVCCCLNREQGSFLGQIKLNVNYLVLSIKLWYTTTMSVYLYGFTEIVSSVHIFNFFLSTQVKFHESMYPFNSH